MQTKIDIPDDLLQQAMRVAARDNTTVPAIVEEGLRMVLRRRCWKTAPSKPRQASFADDERDDLLDGPPRAPWGRRAGGA